MLTARSLHPPSWRESQSLDREQPNQRLNVNNVARHLDHPVLLQNTNLPTVMRENMFVQHVGRDSNVRTICKCILFATCIVSMLSFYKVEVRARIQNFGCNLTALVLRSSKWNLSSLHEMVKYRCYLREMIAQTKKLGLLSLLKLRIRFVFSSRRWQKRLFIYRQIYENNTTGVQIEQQEFF